ncbi:hypothetical protein [Phocaeicola barnesiae]|uniref:hypothetical protein n=1 Tax=Phocaeicola barnesiae TaxID=376804 RepID=UPI00241DA3C9|nr:hypothetical protein [Phocaeicola barnesiae]
MRKCSLICLLLFCVLAGKAQVKKQVLMNVYAANAGLAALDGDEALRKAQLVTSNGATIEYDLAKKEIRLHIHLPEKHDLFYIDKVEKDSNGNTVYQCTGASQQGKVEIVAFQSGDVILAAIDRGVIFMISNKSKLEMLEGE